MESIDFFLRILAMRLKHPLIVCRFLLTLLMCVAASTLWAEKPQLPLQLSLGLVLQDGGRTDLTLLATSQIEADEVTLWVELPSGVVRLEGEEQWTGPLPKGKTKLLTFSVQGMGMQNVVGHAKVKSESLGVLFQQIRVDPPPLPDPLSALPPVIEESGEALLEFQENN
jgi:hypothetical protein